MFVVESDFDVEILGASGLRFAILIDPPVQQLYVLTADADSAELAVLSCWLSPLFFVGSGPDFRPRIAERALWSGIKFALGIKQQEKAFHDVWAVHRDWGGKR